MVTSIVMPQMRRDLGLTNTDYGLAVNAFVLVDVQDAQFDHLNVQRSPDAAFLAVADVDGRYPEGGRFNDSAGTVADDGGTKAHGRQVTQQAE